MSATLLIFFYCVLRVVYIFVNYACFVSKVLSEKDKIIYMTQYLRSRLDFDVENGCMKVILSKCSSPSVVQALTCLQRAAWTAPLSARAAHNLGLALLVCKRHTSAFCRLATAAALQPFQPYTVPRFPFLFENRNKNFKEIKIMDDRIKQRKTQ